MKKIEFLFLFVLLFVSITNVKATTCGNYTQDQIDYIIKNTAPEDLNLSCSNGTIFSQKYISEMESSLNNLYSSVDTKNNIYFVEPRYFVEYFNQLNVPTYVQSNHYYCGPANVKMVLQYINGTSSSQSTYASNMGTNSSEGTYVYKIRNELNKYVPSSKKYAYIVNITKSSLQNYVEQSISNGKPVIASVNTKYLENYNGHTTGHYVTINAHSKNIITEYHFKYVDSNNNSYCLAGACAGMQIESLNNFYNSLAGNNNGVVSTTTSRYVIY